MDVIPMTLKVSKKKVIKLDGNATTGYAWEAKSDDYDVVSVSEAEYSAGLPLFSGSGGKFTFTVEGKSSGNANVTFVYNRGSHTTPIKTKVYTVQVE